MRQKSQDCTYRVENLDEFIDELMTDILKACSALNQMEDELNQKEMNSEICFKFPFDNRIAIPVSSQQ